MNGLIEHLQRTYGLTRERAESRAKFIIQKQAERAAAKKVKLASAQLTLPIEGQTESEEPTNKFESDEELPF